MGRGFNRLDTDQQEVREATALITLDAALPQSGILFTVGDGRAVEIIDVVATVMKAVTTSAAAALDIKIAKENNLGAVTAQGCADFHIAATAGSTMTLTAGTVYRACQRYTAATKAVAGGTTDYTGSTPTVEGLNFDSYWQSIAPTDMPWDLSLGTGIALAPHKLVYDFNCPTATGCAGEVEIRVLYKYSDTGRAI